MSLYVANDFISPVDLPVVRASTHILPFLLRSITQSLLVRTSHWVSPSSISKGSFSYLPFPLFPFRTKGHSSQKRKQRHCRACICVCVYALSHSVMTDFCDPMNCSPPRSSFHSISQVRVLEWVVISYSRGSSQAGIEPTSLAYRTLENLGSI